MKKYQKCVDRVMRSMAEGKISDKQAAEILKFVHEGINKIGSERIAQLSAKESASINQGIHNIAGIILKTDELAAQIAKRQKLLDLRAYRNFINFVMKDPAQMPGKGIELYFERARGAITGMAKVVDDKLASRLEASGLELQYVHNLAGRDEIDFHKELRNLSLEKPASGGVTGNAKAKQLADIYMALNDEALAFNNRNGGYTERAENRTLMQTHDAHLIRRAGIDGFLAKADMDVSYRAWRDFVLGLKINWSRMGIDGAGEREKWLRGFHTNIYTRNFSKAGDMDSVMRPDGGTSLAERHGAERKLWFKDVESELAYAKRFGAGGSVLEKMVAQLHSTYRNGVMMQYFGVNADANVKGALEYIRERNKHSPDSIRRLDSTRRAEAMWEEVTGRTALSERPNVSRFVDGMKNLAMLAKASNLIFSTPPDRINMATSMAYRGVGAMDRFRMQVVGLVARSDNPAHAAAVMESTIQEFIRASAHAYATEIRPHVFGGKAVNRVFKWTGFNLVNNMVKHAAGATYGKAILGANAGKSFESLDAAVRLDLERYGIQQTEWDVWRKYASTFDDTFGTHTFISPEAIDRFTTEDIDTILAKRGDSLTNPNRERLRDRLRADTMALFQEVIEDAATGPTVRGGAIMHGGLARGGLGREVGELFFQLKSYGINAVLRLIERERRRTNTTSLKDWLTEENISLKHRVILHAGAMSLAGLAVVWLSDLRNGRTPSPLARPDEDGLNIQWDTIFNAIARGGAAGMMSDLVLNEYDKRYRDFLSAIMGPTLGESSAVMDISTSLIRGTFQDEDNERETEFRSAGYSATKLIRQNLPLANLFFVKPVMDHLFWHSIAEGFSPGVSERAAEAHEKRGRTYWNEFQDPRNAADEDPLGMRELTESILD